MNTEQVTIRELIEADSEVIAASFSAIGWNKPAEQYRQYFAEQESGRRSVLVAEMSPMFVGYCTVVWEPSYPGFRASCVPEIQDLNVLPPFRRKGVGSRLLDEAERLIAQRSELVGIGVGLHPGYNAAQRLYVMRGYVPDGLGLTYRDRYVQEGEHVVVDNDLTLHFTKDVAAQREAAG